MGTWRDEGLPRPDGLPSLFTCRELIRHLLAGNSIGYAAMVCRATHSPTLAKVVTRWKRDGVVGMVRLEDLTDAELERLLFGARKGKFHRPDFAALHEAIKEHQEPIYPHWLNHFRTAAGRPHGPATFLQAYSNWLNANQLAPLKLLHIEFVHVHIARSMHEFRKNGAPHSPGVKTIVEWQPL